MNGLSVRGLTVGRGNSLALEDVSFSAPQGSVTALLGAPGCGKTTLLCAIAGLMPLARGAVFAGSQEISALPPRKRGVALLPPGTALPDLPTLAATLRRAVPRGAPRDAMLIQALGLSRIQHRRIGDLSHGEALLALTAHRLAAPAPILLVDEAGHGLDNEGRAALWALLRQEAREGATVLVATRAADMALQADHLVLLSAGRLLQAGTPASLYAEPRDELAARLTGRANILRGQVRELRAGCYVWSGAGGRWLQSCDPELPRPVLGGDITLCLRPERMALITEDDPADNSLDAQIADVRSAGALLEIHLLTTLGAMMVLAPSFGLLRYPVPGRHRRVGWSAAAPVTLE